VPPWSGARAAAPEIQAAVVRVRHDPADAGDGSGPDTIAHHLCLELGSAPSVATIWRIVARRGLITPQPRNRPKSSFIRFEADSPNQLWQADSTNWQLADGSGVEILNCVDDHSRVLVVSDAFLDPRNVRQCGSARPSPMPIRRQELIHIAWRSGFWVGVGEAVLRIDTGGGSPRALPRLASELG
jgi:hypothetical protein